MSLVLLGTETLKHPLIYKCIPTLVLFYYDSLEVILRGEMVDKAQPGDRCDFVGTLIVVPDVAQLQTAGSDVILYHVFHLLTLVARAETSARLKGAEGYEQEGVSGLKALGVRDLGYKVAFLACNVLQNKNKVGHC